MSERTEPPTGSSTDGSRWFHRTTGSRDWEDFYRNRWEHDDVHRSSHGVNCSGSCSWQVYSKNDIISWELQAVDYPQIDADVPSYEPRGCQRGISASDYPYSPVRVKYPYVRGRLLEYYREEREAGNHPVDAYAAIVEDPERERAYKRARGKGGWRRTTWDEAVELVAAAQLYTIEEYGPDRMASFSPIPAMSMVSWISGERYAGLLGAPILSFFEYYHDLPHVMPMVWGDQSDVAESADWYQSQYLIVAGTNLPMTRTPDAHFASEFKYDGGKLVNLSPDYSDMTKFADTWVPVTAGSDGAYFLACIHVILNEYFGEDGVDYFRDYVERYTNLPFLVELEDVEGANGARPGRLLRAADLPDHAGLENADGKPVLLNAAGDVTVPKGTIGGRWDDDEDWTLEPTDVYGADYDPALSTADDADEVVSVSFADFTDTFDVRVGGTEDGDRRAAERLRDVPARRIETADGPKLVTTAFDLLLAHFGVARDGLGGDYPTGYDDADAPFTPAWQESETGVDRELVTRIAREWAETAARTEGKCMIITGAGTLHWFHGGSLTHRAMAIMAILTGTVGTNGGGFHNYVGTEKVRPYAAVPFLGTASDWYDAPRQANTTSWMYFHDDQYRYDGLSSDPLLAPGAEGFGDTHHPADSNVMAVRNGWFPFYPQFDGVNSLDLAAAAQEAGAETDEEIAGYVRDRMIDGDLDFAIEHVDEPDNFPKVLWAWRGNLVGSSTRGHEYMLKHLLGTHDNVLGEERSKDLIEEIEWTEEAPTGKLDLLVNVNFRMDSTATYGDVVLPAAHWYEKYDLTCTDLHSFFHPFTPAQDPPWEARDDWTAFGTIAKRFSELAEDRFDGPVKDVVVRPLMTDSPDEIANLEGTTFDWTKDDDVEPVPGKTMPNISVVERDYRKTYDRYVTFGENANEPRGYGSKGIKTDLTPIYESLTDNQLIPERDGRPSLERAENVAETILRISPETDGRMAKLLFEDLEDQVGRDLSHLYEGQADESIRYRDLERQPRRTLTSPHWTGIESGEGTNDRTYSPWSMNVEEGKPWKTLTGRQAVYFDHQAYQQLGEELPTYKPPVDTTTIGEVDMAGVSVGPSKDGGIEVREGAADGPPVGVFRFLTPHGKWHIHSSYGDTWPMKNLSRGGPTAWLNDEVADALGIDDNDWIELYSENGIQVCRAIVSHTVPRDSVIGYHQPERTVNVPFSAKAMEAGVTDLRGGTNNSPVRIMVNPAMLVGGYAHFTYFINYWGPSPSERDMPVAVRKMPIEGDGPIYREEELPIDFEADGWR